MEPITGDEGTEPGELVRWYERHGFVALGPPRKNGDSVVMQRPTGG
ncbi:hypothetical protein [Actinomadura rubrisoli]|nr:hypothetical protein [Actinomadura rubrisoli]